MRLGTKLAKANHRAIAKATSIAAGCLNMNDPKPWTSDGWSSANHRTDVVAIAAKLSELARC